jgi:hypothetical protein
MDFRVDPKAGKAIEFCDPLNPQFIPVVAAKSPVTMSLRTDKPPAAGREIQAVVQLHTGSGKPIAPDDLLVTHTRRMHLLIVDPGLSDYQHVHPEPGARPGEWGFRFTPRLAGSYRVFGDFTPAATGRGLYASAELEVAGTPVIAEDAWTALADGEVVRDGVVFKLRTVEPPRAGKPIELRFAMHRRDGGPVRLEPVMGAFAHLVAFDRARSGFAHLHPTEADLTRPLDGRHPVLSFKLTVPDPGEYVVWAQVNSDGEEAFVPFQLRVQD